MPLHVFLLPVVVNFNHSSPREAVYDFRSLRVRRGGSSVEGRRKDPAHQQRKCAGNVSRADQNCRFCLYSQLDKSSPEFNGGNMKENRALLDFGLDYNLDSGHCSRPSSFRPSCRARERRCTSRHRGKSGARVVVSVCRYGHEWRGANGLQSGRERFSKSWTMGCRRKSRI